MILEQREENTELVKYVEDERRFRHAGLLTRAKWWLRGMDASQLLLAVPGCRNLDSTSLEGFSIFPCNECASSVDHYQLGRKSLLMSERQG